MVGTTLLCRPFEPTNMPLRIDYDAPKRKEANAVASLPKLKRAAGRDGAASPSSLTLTREYTFLYLTSFNVGLCQRRGC